MSFLHLLVPIAISLVLLALTGAPTDVEFSAGASLLAASACFWVAFSFSRQFWRLRHLAEPTENDELLRWMLLTMTIVAVDIGVIMAWRFGAFVALAWGVAWFQENRLIGALLTLNLAGAMIAKLKYPLQRAWGPAWASLVATGASLLFFLVVGAL